MILPNTIHTSHMLSPINTHILKVLLENGPLTEPRIIAKGKPNGFKHLSDGAFQVKINRALRMMHRYGIIRIANKERTHGGMISKTYALYWNSLYVLLQDSTWKGVLKKIKTFSEDISRIVKNNPRLVPIPLHFIKNITDEDELAFLKEITYHFYWMEAVHNPVYFQGGYLAQIEDEIRNPRPPPSGPVKTVNYEPISAGFIATLNGVENEKFEKFMYLMRRYDYDGLSTKQFSLFYPELYSMDKKKFERTHHRYSKFPELKEIV